MVASRRRLLRVYLSRSQVHLIINILRNCQTCKKEFSRKKTKKHHLRDNIHILNIHTIPTFHTEKGDHSACTTQENFTVDIVATKKPPMKKIHRKLPIILLYNVYTNQILASVVTIKSHVRATDGMLTRSSGECGCCKSGPIEIMSISG